MLRLVLLLVLLLFTLLVLFVLNAYGVVICASLYVFVYWAPIMHALGMYFRHI